jgi:hypothetical protein
MFLVNNMQIMCCTHQAATHKVNSLSTLLTSEVTQHNSVTPGRLLRNTGRKSNKLHILNTNCLPLVTSVTMDKISNLAMWFRNDHLSAIVNFVISIDTCSKYQFISANLSSCCNDWNYCLFSTETKEKIGESANTPTIYKQTMVYVH